MRQDQLNARKRLGLGDINLANLSVSVRAAQYSGIKHPGEVDVAAVGSLPRDAFHSVNARGGVANRLQGSESGQTAHRAPPAPVVETTVFRRPFVAGTSALDLVAAGEGPKLLLDAVAFFVAAAANTAST